ncbi:TfoX/Sxy family DNA transformation protein [Pasteurella sp. PK-2025]|uniref:TfoX/Sxy family DNA transformation protein n=1 Tax=unclassified Pasteurella TaxID=2621516 RepID=UPI003C72C345
MIKTEQDTLEIRLELHELIGEVTAKGLFASYGLFKEGTMFGLYQHGVFYLRAENEFATYLESQGAASYLSYEIPGKLNLSCYYRLPQALIKDKTLYKSLLERSIQQAQEQKHAAAQAKLSRIKDLPNLSVKYERLLAKVDIHDLSLFKTLGAINSYVRLKKKGITAEIGIFWALSAALQNKNVNLMTQQEKENELKNLNIALADAGLRDIKKI